MPNDNNNGNVNNKNNNGNRRFKHKKPSKIDNSYRPPYPATVLAESVNTLKLREETLNLLLNAKVATLNDVLIREEKDFYRISTFNKKNLFDLKNALQLKKLALKPSGTLDNKEPNRPAPVLNNKTVENPNAVQKPVQRSLQNNKDKQNRTNKDNDKYGVINTASFSSILPEKPPRVVVVPEKEVPDIYVKVNKSGKWGFKDRNGKQMVAPLYDEVYNFKEDLCCVEKAEMCGFINREGEEIIPIIYDCAMSFSEGLACVYKKEKCGYINTKNETIIDFKFDAGTAVINGECRVKRDGKWGELHIDKPNEIRWIT